MSRKDSGQKLQALYASSQALVSAAAMHTLFTDSAWQDLPGMALAKLGLGTRGDQDPGYSIPTLGLETGA